MVKTLPGADCGSEHKLLMVLQIRKTKTAEHPIRYCMIHIPEQINVDIKNRFAVLIPIVDEMMPNELQCIGKDKDYNCKSCQREIIVQTLPEETVDIERDT